MRRHVLILGLISGFILIAMMFLTVPLVGDEVDFDKAEWLGYFSIIVALSTIFIGIKSYRDKEGGGIISFGRAFQVGLYITLVASVLYVAGWMLYANTTGAGFVDSYFEYNTEKIKNSGDSEAKIQAQIANMEKWRDLYMNPLVQIGMTFLEIFPVGLLITIISAAILKKKRE